MSVQIVTDSTSDIPQETAASLGITVVPLTVFFGEEAFRDGVDLGADRFFGLLQSSSYHPRTSAPAVGDFEQAYERLAPLGPVLSIHVSSKLSGTMNSAFAARASLSPDGQIEILDSETASIGLGLAAIAAARAAREGVDLDGCIAAAKHVIDHQKLYFVVDTLEYLRKGGRIGRAAALVGGILNIKPILMVADGVVTPFERVRARPKAIARLKELLANGRNVTDIGIIHATSPKEAAQLVAYAKEHWPNARVGEGQRGPVVGTYTGPGVLGFCMVEDV